MGWEDPLEDGMAYTPVFLPGESHGQRNLAGYNTQGHKESDMTEATQQGTEQQIIFFLTFSCQNLVYYLMLVY